MGVYPAMVRGRALAQQPATVQVLTIVVLNITARNACRFWHGTAQFAA